MPVDSCNEPISPAIQPTGSNGNSIGLEAESVGSFTQLTGSQSKALKLKAVSLIAKSSAIGFGAIYKAWPDFCSTLLYEDKLSDEIGPVPVGLQTGKPAQGIRWPFRRDIVPAQHRLTTQIEQSGPAPEAT